MADPLPVAWHLASRCAAEGFFGLVVIAQAKHPVPSRTRPLSAVAPMVLRLKTWESRSLPNLKNPLPRISLTVIPPQFHRVARAILRVRHRTVRTRGALPQETAKAIVFTLVRSAAKARRRLKGANRLPMVTEGVT